ncbi:MAG TPA: hypothetical protein VEK79_12670 [Thermoanaerobaculia bacterium]|nr:hypothetical protein [Thermoanaerobaculia bacterium]
MNDTLAGALADVMRWMTEEELPGVVIGGVAASLLGRPRVTRDVDAIVLGDDIGWDAVIASAQRYGIAPRIDDLLEFAQQKLFGLKPLTQRDAKANDLLRLLSLKKARQDCPTSLAPPSPVLLAAQPRLTIEERALIDAEPIPEYDNLCGTLLIMMKTEIEMYERPPMEIDAIRTKVANIRTRGEARAYIAS